jgi:hypothetical protein
LLSLKIEVECFARGRRKRCVPSRSDKKDAPEGNREHPEVASGFPGKDDPRASRRALCGARVFALDQIMMRISAERFRAKWTPVRVKKTRQNKNLELLF